jgi:hypothetical protein
MLARQRPSPRYAPILATGLLGELHPRNNPKELLHRWLARDDPPWQVDLPAKVSAMSRSDFAGSEAGAGALEVSERVGAARVPIDPAQGLKVDRDSRLPG